MKNATNLPHGWNWHLDTYEPAVRGLPIRFCAHFTLRDQDDQMVEHVLVDEVTHAEREERLRAIMDAWIEHYAAAATLAPPTP